MRLKQLLGILLLLLAQSAMAAASASQLTDVGLQAKEHATTVTIRANGAFTHTEYRPTDNLLLVDLAGVSAAKLENKGRDLHGQYPGVESYRVVAYKGTNGSSITRVEMSLASNAVVNVDEGKNLLSVHVSSNAPTTAETSPAPVVAHAKAAEGIEHATPISHTSGKPVQVRNVSLARGKDGMNVEIVASGAVDPKVIKLSAPDRVVIDIPNSVPTSKQREIAVNNSEVKGIRVALFSVNPPSTRIVVDLNSAHEFETANAGNRVTVKLHPLSEIAKTTVPAPVAVAQKSSETVSKPAAPAVAQAAVVVEPTVTTRPATQDEIAATLSADHATVVTTTRGNSELPVIPVNASLKTQPALNVAMMPQQAAAPSSPATQSGSCGSNKYNGEPISVNLKDIDLRDFFRLVHDISGLNVVLDPAVRGSLTIVLDDVPWDQALQIVLKNNSLDCELQGNVLRIATTSTMKKEADDRRAQNEAQALAVEMVTINRPLSYAVAKDAVPTIKTFLSARGTIIADERTNALIISDIPNVMPNIDGLIRQLDKKTQEVEIEARVVAASRNFARDIGTQLGFGWGSRSTSVGGAAAAGSSPISAPAVPGVIQIGTSAPSAGTLVQIPLFSNTPAIGPNAGLSFLNIGANYRVDAILTAAENRGLLKILSRPRVVTQNNVAALVKQGRRIPTVTAAQLGGPPTVSYTDAFLRLSVKPQITAEGTIFLNVDVENTTADFGNAINGNPTLVTQQATTQVLVTDGGTVVIGGVIQSSSSVNVTQFPVLGNIPVLGNLFKRRAVSTTTQELIFFITPKIIQT
ncbi:MAG: type and secretion system protein [Candidatus Angelobacter sp.]|jgi:type IV pilus assembly protein PilQ|nr:type and secretion system protein [Candidatus Angelobacter sp.]